MRLPLSPEGDSLSLTTSMARRIKPKEYTQDPFQNLNGNNNSQTAFQKENYLKIETALDAEELELEEPATGEQEPDITVFRPDREGVRKVLGDLESDIMEYVWDNIKSTPQGLTVRDVYEDFRLRRAIAYTTVMSTMARLGRKHLLRVKKVDGAYVYTPSLSKEEFINNFVSRILENLLVSFSHSTEEYLNRVETDQHSTRVTALKAKMAALRQAENAGDKLSKETGPQSPPSSPDNSKG